MPSSFEVVNPHVRRGPFRAVLFDFDGTLSLIREGWPRVMVGMMADILRGLKLAEEPAEELWGQIERFVMALNGHPTVVQMARFADEVKARGGTPDAPTAYLQEYLDRLMGVVRQRWELLESTRVAAEEWVVPNAHAVLRNLHRRGVPVFLASGTDLEAVRHEGQLLKVLPFFGGHVYAPLGVGGTGIPACAGQPAQAGMPVPPFSKGRVVDSILSTLGIRGEELLGFGDGVVETQEVKRVGGVAVGVASAEPGQFGVNADKRTRLATAGADLIIPDYAEQESLLAWLWDES